MKVTISLNAGVRQKSLHTGLRQSEAGENGAKLYRAPPFDYSNL
jgi:hypothetical protein